MRGGILFCAAVLAAAPELAQADGDVVDVARRLGITPEALVVAELQTAASAVLTELAAESELSAQIMLLNEQADQAAAQVAILGDQLASDPENEELLMEHAAAATQFHQALDQLQATRTTLLASITDQLPQELVNGLIAWRRAAMHDVPPSYRVLDLTEMQWKRVVRALRSEQRAQRRGVELAPEHSAVLDAIRTDPRVAAAEVRLTQFLSTVESIFDQFEGG